MSRTNDVTLFSNGIGHFRRVYKVPAGKQEAISIPFKRDHIGDVAASLQVFGQVRLNTPPSFTPSNANATALHIDSSEAFLSLLRSLSGAEVRVKYNNGSSADFTLLGVETEEKQDANGNVSSQKHFVVVKDERGSVKRKSLCEIEDVEFTEDSVKAEIGKALKNNFQQIKPESTSLDLSLSALGDQDTEAAIQYTIPVAAWKMRYAIRQDKDKQGNEKFVLEGAAIIDNNTDEDWDNFRVSVVTGNPISFNTDIATVSVPQRKFVRLVENDVLGNVEVQEAYAMAACAAPAGGGYESTRGATKGVRLASARGFNKMSTSNYSQAGLESLAQYADGDANLEMDYESVAEAPGVESKEVGDFCVFTSKEPITILARKSAVVPMFTVPLTKAGVVLLYKESNHARRPFRAVKFKNESEFSLGKGKTVIYNEGVFSGECVLETTKPGENRMLPHCLENGVKIVKEQPAVENRRASLKISEGVGIVEDVSTAVTKYVLENKKDETFKVAVEHYNALGGSPNVNVDFEGVELKDREKLASGNGYRLYFELAPKQSVTLKATETLLNQHKSVLGNYYNWLKVNVIDVKNPLAKDKGVLAAQKVQAQIDEVQAQVNEARQRRQELTEQAERVRENITATKDVGNSTTVAEWVRDLDATEKEIRTIDKKTVPDLNTKLKDLAAKLGEEIRKIEASWKA